MTSKQKSSSRYFVGIGASAGGLEAISSFFKHMPLDTGLTFIVIQHLSPDYKSMMDELLSKVTAIPVHVVKDGVEALANNIYLIPPRQNMTIFHGKLLLETQDRADTMVNLPIDLFLHSLAEDQKHNAIGVILSGTGSDGTRGCRAIKEAGGLVMAQSEASAKFTGMPKNVVANGLSDFVLPVEDLPEQLLNFVKHPLEAKLISNEVVPKDTSSLTKLFAMLRQKTKIDFTFYKPPTIMRRIDRRMSINQAFSIDDYVQFVSNNPAELTALYRELLIGVTNFYRDPDVFDSILNEYLLDYISKMEGDELRIWVAGCSTGEEAYTYCMLVQEILERLDKTIDLKLFATDIDQEALNKASQGIYPESIAADLPKILINKYFIRKDDHYQIARHLREMVVFARHDLIKDPPFTNMNLVSCRNLLIYLQPVLQQRIFESFNFSLKQGGMLVLGSSESLGQAEAFFEVIDHRKNIFRSRGHRRSLLTSERYKLPEPQTGITQPGRSHAFENRNNDELRVLESYIDSLAGEFIPVSFIVNDSFELIRVTGNARNYLAPLSGKVSTDVTKNLIKDLSVPVATGLTKVFKTSLAMKFSNIRIKVEGENKKVNVDIKPLEIRRHVPIMAVVIISEVKTLDLSPDNESIKYDADAEVHQRVSDLEQELQFSRENLQATIEELETSNEELQATNEELLASNEELQSTNEELQSVNEELFTVNAEYQSKISELSELNADMENFMGASELLSIFLDTNLQIRRFMQSAKQLFNILDHDIGRPFEHLSHRLPGVDLVSMVRQVADTGLAISMDVKAEDLNWYLLRILPYKLNHNVHGGVIIALHDISELKASQEHIARANQRKLLAQKMTQSTYWEMDLADRSVKWSEGAEDLFGVDILQINIDNDFLTKIIQPDDSKRVQAEIAKILSDGQPFKTKFSVVINSENYLIEQNCMMLKNESDEKTHLLGVIRRIDELSCPKANSCELKDTE
ncbi:chemotaxis protein CheB [uncultured Amphritea sp.]|uniref:chemotaxis protein CheB n=1 Tax=uncultured Amphritea sp. TaxID=981605 RepID=UPI00261F35B5|nr:chemotaxis protein CheB [uncultured Amphritea sp.]